MSTPGQKDKENLIVNLLKSSEPIEAKYIIRFIAGSLKHTFGTTIIQYLLGTFFQEVYATEDKDAWELAVRRGCNQCPNYRKVIQSLQECKGSIKAFAQNCTISPGVPCKPMLAKPTKDIKIIFTRFEGRPFVCEYKYDGLRGQIHYNQGVLTVFSRNCENITEQYPDIIKLFKSTLKPETTSFIVDSEIVAHDQKTGKILPFQVLMKRHKKKVTEDNITTPICVYMFDLLYYNGKSLVESTFKERRTALKEHIGTVPKQLVLVDSRETDEFTEIDEFMRASVDVGCEGLMVKTLEENSTYEPSKRSYKWLKLKVDYLDAHLADSLDLVVIGAKLGEGRRNGLFGAFLMACYNREQGRYETTGCVGTGFSDEQMKDLHKRLQPHIIKGPQKDYLLVEGGGAKSNVCALLL